MPIKLPQQSQLDFISEICIVPMETNDNALFLNARNTSAAPTLDNCVTCVGCITSAEEIFVKESNAEMLNQLNQAQQPLQFVFSRSAQLMINSEEFLQQNTTHSIEFEDLEQVAKIHSDFQNYKIITHCPAVRLYILKKRPDLYCLVNKEASPLELQLEGKIYISACHDRKIESMKNSSQCFTINEFIEVFGCQNGSLNQSFNKFQLQDFITGEYQIKQGINSDQTVYQFNDFKLIHSTNYRNLENLIRKAEQVKKANDVYLVEACPRGCFGGAQSGITKEMCKEIPQNILTGQHTQILQKNVSTCFDKIEETMQSQVQGIKVGDLQW